MRGPKPLARARKIPCLPPVLNPMMPNLASNRRTTTGRAPTFPSPRQRRRALHTVRVALDLLALAQHSSTQYGGGQEPVVAASASRCSANSV